MFSFCCSYSQNQVEDVLSGSCGPSLNWSLDVETSTLFITGTGPMTDFSTRYVENDEISEEMAQLTEKQKKKLKRKILRQRAKARTKNNFVQDDMSHFIPWYNYHSIVKKIVVEPGATTIGDNAFKGFEELRTVILPNTLELIGRESFYWCTSLDSINIPESVNTISMNSFNGCYTMKSVSFGRKLSKIEKGAFYKCQRLNKVNYYGSINDWIVTDFVSENSNPLKYAGRLYIYGNLVTEISVPDTIVEIPPYAFMGLTSLRKLHLHENVTKVSIHSFDGCRQLNTVVSRAIVPPVVEKYAFLNTDIHYIYIQDADVLDAYIQSWGKKYTYYINKLGKKDDD